MHLNEEGSLAQSSQKTGSVKAVRSSQKTDHKTGSDQIKVSSFAPSRLLLIALILFSAIGLIASFVLSADYTHLLRDPDLTLSCDINAVLSCVSVMKTAEATLIFGIPNSYFGMIGFAVLLTIAVVIATGARLPRWFRGCLQLAAFGGIAFAWWMFFDALYGIGILCPWCLTVTASMTILFGAITNYNLRAGTFGLAEKIQDKVVKWLDFGADKLVIVLILILFIILAFLRFGAELVS
jgi:uncharacterized membrane protein